MALPFGTRAEDGRNSHCLHFARQPAATGAGTYALPWLGAANLQAKIRSRSAAPLENATCYIIIATPEQ